MCQSWIKFRLSNVEVNYSIQLFLTDDVSLERECERESERERERERLRERERERERVLLAEYQYAGRANKNGERHFLTLNAALFKVS
jgi:hypothetical protein